MIRIRHHDAAPPAPVKDALAADRKREERKRDVERYRAQRSYVRVKHYDCGGLRRAADSIRPAVKAVGGFAIRDTEPPLTGVRGKLVAMSRARDERAGAVIASVTAAAKAFWSGAAPTATTTKEDAMNAKFWR